MAQPLGKPACGEVKQGVVRLQAWAHLLWAVSADARAGAPSCRRQPHLPRCPPLPLREGCCQPPACPPLCHPRRLAGAAAGECVAAPWPALLAGASGGACKRCRRRCTSSCLWGGPCATAAWWWCRSFRTPSGPAGAAAAAAATARRAGAAAGRRRMWRGTSPPGRRLSALCQTGPAQASGEQSGVCELSRGPPPGRSEFESSDGPAHGNRRPRRRVAQHMPLQALHLREGS
jgi:hypothetical protein